MIWLILLASVAFIGGLIGWAGDLIGRKIGRKHVRLLGLRPRASGVLVAILSGVAVALLSVGAVAVLARDALNTALEAQEVRAERDQVRSELGKVNTDLTARLADLNRTRAAKTQLAAQLDQARRSLDLSQGQLTGVREELDRTSRVNAELVGQRDDLNSRIEQLGRTIKTKTLELNRSVAASKEQAAKIADLNQSLSQLTGQRARLNADLAKLQAQRDGLSAQRADLERHVRQLADQKSALEARNASLHAQLGNLQGQLATLQAQVEPLQARVKALNAQTRALAADRAAAEAAKHQAQDDTTALNLLRATLRNDIDNLKQRTSDLTAQLNDTNKKLASAVSTRNQVQLDLARAKAALEIERRGAQSEDLVCRKDEAIAQVSLPNGADSAALHARLQDGYRQADALIEARGAGRSHPLSQDAVPIDRAVTQAQADAAPNVATWRCDRNLARGLQASLRVDVTPVKVLFHAGSPVRQMDLSIGTGSNPRADGDIRADLLKLQVDLMNDLKSRGVPLDGLSGPLVGYDDVTEFIARLRSNARLEPGHAPSSSVTVALSPRTDVTTADPSSYYLVTVR
ncbi:MAG TPA: DUF3084 domain-containing protein [Deinococcales bacterium]|nr:DUF3084 domain-containing protein [Deinococcales bacterium]